MAQTSNDLNIQDAGYVVFDGISTFNGRTFQAGTGITISNPSGVGGNSTIATTASLTDLHTAKFIVSSEGTTGTGANFTTIAAAIASAQGTGINSTIFIMPGNTGTYTENFTIPANINLTAFNCDAQTPNVTIIGNITCTDAGSRTISGIRLQTNSAAFLTVSGSAATVVNLTSCYLNCSNNTGITYSSSSGSSRINIDYCKGDLGTTGIGLYSMSSAGELRSIFSAITNSGTSTTASNNSAGNVILRYFYSEFVLSTSGTTSGLQIFKCFFNTDGFNTTAVTHNSTNASPSSIDDSFIGGGTASAISVGASATLKVRCAQIASSNTNAITGSGSVSFADLIFVGTSSKINTTTQIPLPFFSGARRITSPGAYPYTTIASDDLILVDTSSARTIIPLASPTTGQTYTIKDSVGSAAANNITITPSGKNIDGAASKIINIAYGSVDITYNGSEWSVT